MITCVELTELVSEYIEGRLSRWDRLRFWLHIRLCPVCLDYIQQLAVTRATLGRMPDEPIPAPVRDELLACFQGWKRSEDLAADDPASRSDQGRVKP